MVALLHVATVNGGPFMSFGHGWWLSPVKRQRKRSEPVKVKKERKKEKKKKGESEIEHIILYEKSEAMK